MDHVKIESAGSGISFHVGNDLPMTIFAGPCMMESAGMVSDVADTMREICEERGLNYVFKGSYDKANRSSYLTERGPGLGVASEMLARLDLQCPVMVDVHSPMEAIHAAEFADVLQIPAFLCRQLDLLAAACSTGKPVNVKKGQFASAGSMRNVLDNAAWFGEVDPYPVILTERGTAYGPGNLVVDPREVVTLRDHGAPVLIDCTHSCQTPSRGSERATGGQIEFAGPIAASALVHGLAGVFMEVHPAPHRALSDMGNQIALSEVEYLIDDLLGIDGCAKRRMETAHV